MIDATIVRAHQHSAGARKKPIVNQAIGRSRGGLTTKIHMVVDALQNPPAFSLTGGQVHDITQAETLTAEIAKPRPFFADKAADRLRLIRCEPRGPRDQAGYPAQSEIAKSSAIAISPSTPSAIWLNDSFQFIKQFRGRATCYEKHRPQFPCRITTRLRAHAWLK